MTFFRGHKSAFVADFVNFAKNNALKSVELLAPAKDFQSAVAAVDYGADAVYIGGAKFGARYAAGNSAGEIARVVEYAHRYGVRVHATLNTLIYDDELEAAGRQARELIAAGVDALIVQDMALRRMNLPVELHASTQMCNMTPAQARFLGECGFARVILERALSLGEIRDICAATAAEVECFVHGAICVGYSGRCFLSRSVSDRSGNRGACSQPCRLTYDLTDGRGRTYIAGKHLLSVRDLNLSAHIGELLDAGDGICFLTDRGFAGTNVNAADGDCVTPNRMEGIVPGTEVYRNYDHRFNQLLARSRTRRVIPASVLVEATAGGVRFSYTDCEGVTASAARSVALERAKNAAANTAALRTQAVKGGDTVFAVRGAEVRGGDWFVPASLAAELRREGLDALSKARSERGIRHRILPEGRAEYPAECLSAEENVTNRLAEAFYRDHGVGQIERGLDLAASTAGRRVMRSAYCIRREIGECLKEHPRLRGELWLERGGSRYRLEFDCNRCEMSLVDCTKTKL